MNNVELKEIKVDSSIPFAGLESIRIETSLMMSSIELFREIKLDTDRLLKKANEDDSLDYPFIELLSNFIDPSKVTTSTQKNELCEVAINAILEKLSDVIDNCRENIHNHTASIPSNSGLCFKKNDKI